MPARSMGMGSVGISELPMRVTACFTSGNCAFRIFSACVSLAPRFAISFHQKSKRKLDLQSSKLLSLGVSKGSLKKLLDFYGDFESIYAASFEEIRSLTNIQTAEKILNNH